MASSYESTEELVNDAFNKLSSYIYFDKQNLLIRKRLAEFLDQGKQRDLNSFAKAIESNDSSIESMLNEQINLTFLPKSIKANSDSIDSKFLSTSFYTNQVYKDASIVDKAAIFIDAPLEIHLISTMWILEYGRYFDGALGDYCIGNRLEFFDRKLKGRLLFKKYELQYQNWWSNGINAAKELFDQHQHVTILNFDFKDYYHSIELDLEELTVQIQKHEPYFTSSNLHSIFLKIHKKYLEKMRATGHDAIRSNVNAVPLPIGLLSSSVLANWYLKDFDESILNNKSIVHYGRYVDDLMIVVENTLISEFNQKQVEEIRQNNIIFSNDKHYIVYHYISKIFSAIFKLNINDKEEPVYSVDMKKYENLTLQSDKFFIYQFNVDFSPQLLNKFSEEQQEKSSAFQFLSEDDDNIYKDLNKITFESNFDSEDINSGALKHIEENKFKLSIYLSKLARGSMVSGSDYDPEEAKKVKKYFKGFYLLKNYFFWEKLLSIWIVREDYDSFFETIENIHSQIKNFVFRPSRKPGSAQRIDKMTAELRNALTDYLNVSIRMSVGLHPGILELALKKNQNQILIDLSDLDLYRRTWLLRKNLVFYPLLQFTEIAKKGKEPLFKRTILDQCLKGSTSDLTTVADFYPYRAKFNECCQIAFLQFLSRANKIQTEESKAAFDFLNVTDFLNESFNIFCTANNIHSVDRDEVKNEYFKFSTLNTEIEGITFPNDVRVTPIKIGNRKAKEDRLRVCLVNKFVDFRESKKSMQGNPASDNARYEGFNRIFDDIKKVNGADIFIMPEICIPYHFIPQSILFSVYNQVGFITGVEHWRSGQFIFNFVLTVLPIQVYDDRDSIVIPRLKNHYAPEEEKAIIKEGFKIPKPKPCNYELILWNETYFSIYYCFELADVRHRNMLLGLVDVLFAPVWNMDVHYYNSLVESASRDMHCFIVLANTTQFGDSRITRPANHIRKDKLRIKGGTVKDHKAIVVVSDLEISRLRDFQTGVISVKEGEPEEQIFKPLPPNFPSTAAELRKELQLFEIDKDIHFWYKP